MSEWCSYLQATNLSVLRVVLGVTEYGYQSFKHKVIQGQVRLSECLVLNPVTHGEVRNVTVFIFGA
jgi:hypothetical protein